MRWRAGIGVLALVLALAIVALSMRPARAPARAPEPAPAAADTTLGAQLSAAGAVCYGAEWCGFTRKQIDALKGVDYAYVDCVKDKAACAEQGVHAYPTWVINGQKHAGFMTAARLGSICAGAPQS